MSNVYDVKLTRRPPCYIDVSSNSSSFTVHHVYWYELYFDVDGYNMGRIVFNEGWWYEPNDNNDPSMSGESLLFLGEVVIALNSFEGES